MRHISFTSFLALSLCAVSMVPELARAQASPGESSLEVRAFRLLNGGAANPVLDAVMPAVTDFDRSRWLLILVWAGLVLFGKRKGRYAALMLIPLIAASDQISASLIKPLVGRMRPCEVLGGVHLWHGAEGWITTPAEVARSYKSSWSFPSSHATNITAGMLFLGLVWRRALPALLAVAVLVSWSRIYIGVHWPLDVLAGMAIGAALGWLAWIVYRRMLPGGGRSDDQDGADGLLDDPGDGAPEEEISNLV
ncbi:MAG: phosphatase PAP2 family protein [Candidatus Krumholzibacteria bacterium]|nr:phosphatase PAP2 family protein [Candidatus Krumholzibacteria bacterium]